MPWPKGKKRRPLTVEEKRKISEATKKGLQNHEIRKKMSEAKKGKPSPNKGKKFNKEHKANISNAIKEYWDELPAKEREDRLNNMAEYMMEYWSVNTVNTSIETAMQELLDSLNIEYETQVYFRSDDQGFFADIYVPSKNTIIECNGDYWHSLPERIERDKQLQQYCDVQGIKLFWCWESDINKNPYEALKKAHKEYNKRLFKQD